MKQQLLLKQESVRILTEYETPDDPKPTGTFAPPCPVCSFNPTRPPLER